MVLRCASNMLVANNTFAGIQYFVFAISHIQGGWGGSIEGLRVVNNVISISTGKVYGIETDMPASVQIDNNVVQVDRWRIVASVIGRGSTNSLSTLRSWTGYEQHGMQADPLFVNAPANDYPAPLRLARGRLGQRASRRDRRLRRRRTRRGLSGAALIVTIGG